MKTTDSNVYLSFLAIISLLVFVTSACGQDRSRSVEALVLAYEEADHSTSIVDALKYHDEESVVQQILIRLDAVANPNQHPEGKQRLWKLLATLGSESTEPINDESRVEELALALEFGDSEVRLEVAKNLHRIDPVQFPAIYIVARNQIAIETSDYILRSLMTSLSKVGEMDSVAISYAEQIYANLSSVPEALQTNIFHQDGPLQGEPNQRGMLLKQTALASVLRSKTDLQVATNYVIGLSDTDSVVPTAMVMAGGVDGPLGYGSVLEIEQWLSEYARRFCLDSGERHRNKYSISYLMHVWEELGDLVESPVCASVQAISASCSPDSFRGYNGITQLVSELCD